MCNSYLMESFISMRIKWHKQKLGSILLLFSCYLFFFNLSFLGICFYVGQNFIYLFRFVFHSRVFFSLALYFSQLTLDILVLFLMLYYSFLSLILYSSCSILGPCYLFWLLLLCSSWCSIQFFCNLFQFLR
jgi:hypothetical protein